MSAAFFHVAADCSLSTGRGSDGAPLARLHVSFDRPHGLSLRKRRMKTHRSHLLYKRTVTTENYFPWPAMKEKIMKEISCRPKMENNVVILLTRDPVFHGFMRSPIETVGRSSGKTGELSFRLHLVSHGPFVFSLLCKGP